MNCDMQPTPQTYNPAFFPTIHGKAVLIFQPEGKGVQTEFAYFPDNFLGSYVMNVVGNTMKTLTALLKVDLSAGFAVSMSLIVMLGSDGVVRALAYDLTTTTSGGIWQTMSKLPTVNFASITSSSLDDSTAGSYNSNSSSLDSTSSSPQKSAGHSGLISTSVAWAMLVGTDSELVWHSFGSLL